MPGSYRGITSRVLAALRELAELDGFEAVVPPVYRTAIYRFPNPEGPRLRGRPVKYSREENPTVYLLERVLAALEEGEDALAFSSGMAAISTTILALLEPGSRVVVSREAYGATLSLLNMLRRWGLEVVPAGPDTEEIAYEASRKGTSLVLVETITNPLVRVIDVPEVVKAARESGATVVVDNTFATPVLFQPLRYGADLVVHSLTKYIAGHNDVVGGAVVGPYKLVSETLWQARKLLGTMMDPEQAYLVIRGAKTLELRMERHCRNAMHVAEHLADHPKVVEVYYPGLPGSPSRTEAAEKLLPPGMYGGVVSFRIRGGRDEVHRFMARLKLVRPSPSLGGTESIISYPVESSHSTLPPEERRRLGITEDLVRLSVGLEDPNDIVEDLDQALAAV
jgi:cystathionine gamma-synthase